jgi:hypothetical protein
MSDEKRTEYRVVGENRDGKWEGRPCRERKPVEREAGALSRPGPRPNTNVRIQKRTVTESDWEDMADA